MNHLTGFEDPMRLFQFVTNFGLAMWSIDTWAKVPISLKERQVKERPQGARRARTCAQSCEIFVTIRFRAPKEQFTAERSQDGESGRSARGA